MSTANPAEEALDLWRKSVEEGTRAWLSLLRQPGTPLAAPIPPPPFDFTQSWRPILTQGMEMWQTAASERALTPEFMQQWKSFVDQWVEAWSKALGEAMATEGFAQVLGRYLDQFLAAQAPMKKGLEQHTDTALKTLGLPSRAQVVSVASQVVALEERIEGIEDRLDELKTLLKDTVRAIAEHEAAEERRDARSTRAPGVGRPEEGS